MVTTAWTSAADKMAEAGNGAALRLHARNLFAIITFALLTGCAAGLAANAEKLNGMVGWACIAAVFASCFVNAAGAEFSICRVTRRVGPLWDSIRLRVMTAMSASIVLGVGVAMTVISSGVSV